MKNKNKIYWVWLSLVCRPASRTAVKLLHAFGDAESVYEADTVKLLGSGIVKEKDRVFSELLRHDLKEAKEIVEWCNKNDVSILTPDDDGYPAYLSNLNDSPVALYVAGTLPDFEKYCSIAVVGSRDMSDYGKINSFKFGFGLAKGGAVVVSGLALGVDGMAMASAIAGGGVTVGVLGSGIDAVYPKEHLSLYNSVIKNGAIVTEYPPGTRPQGSNFPQRNRLISGLSVGTLVIEATADSGSLITARHALYQSKDTFALPGAVGNKMSEGTNELLKFDAFAVTDPVDILKRYEYVFPHTVNPSSADIALRDVDLAASSVRVEMKYGVATAEDRKRVYSRRKNKYYFDGNPIVKTGEVTDDFEWDVPFIEEAPDESVQKPPVLSAEDIKTLDERKKSRSCEPKRVDFELLSETDIRVYKSMLPDTPMLPEELISDDLSISQIMASLTMLEISGAVEAGAGGYFMRNSADVDFEDSDS
ncbi:MAG: DNA-processing protein DprA [Clostridia bacterium]|nr:DNA-processing protein DprA [Clostridia bacterium]